jgi:hypothetical protein
MLACKRVEVNIFPGISCPIKIYGMLFWVKLRKKH